MAAVACDSADVYEKTVGPGFELTETNAVEITGEALAKHGFDTKQMIPVPFHPDSGDLFARNRENADQGYVLWHNVEQSTKYEHVVTINRDSGVVRCRIKGVK